MTCNEVRPLLVAYQDAELSPGELTLVREHLSGCSTCANHEAALAAVTPEPFLQHDPVDLAHKWARLDAAIEHELDHPHVHPVQRPLSDRAWDSLATEWPLSTGSVLAYAAALMLVALWGAANWKHAQDLEMALAATAAPPIAAPSAPDPDVIPAVDFRPVAYTPDEAPQADLTGSPEGQ